MFCYCFFEYVKQNYDKWMMHVERKIDEIEKLAGNFLARYIQQMK